MILCRYLLKPWLVYRHIYTATMLPNRKRTRISGQEADSVHSPQFNATMSNIENTVIHTVVKGATPSCPFEELQDGILFHILSFTFSASEYNVFISAFANSSKCCLRTCLGYMQTYPIAVSADVRLICHDDASISKVPLKIAWMNRYRVKIGRFTCIHHITPLSYNMAKHTIESCNFDNLTDLHIHRHHHQLTEFLRDFEVLSKNFPISIFDENYQIHDALVRKIGQAGQLEILRVQIFAEAYHRPILSTFASSLKMLVLTVMRFTRCNKIYKTATEDISTAIENMPRLETLHIMGYGTEYEEKIEIKSKSVETLILGCGCPHISFVDCPKLKDLTCHDGRNANLSDEDILDINSNGQIQFPFSGNNSRLTVKALIPANCLINVYFDQDEEWNDQDSESGDETSDSE